MNGLDGTHYISTDGSGTAEVVSLSQRTNVGNAGDAGKKGRLFYRVDGDTHPTCYGM